VLSGKREGSIDENLALSYCNQIESYIGIDAILSLVDEVHTMTSLVGFEALLRGKIVVCYGTPFYAGWGLTIDKREAKRRNRELTLLELLAGAYILYPKYINPTTLKPCEIESVLEFLALEKGLYHNSFIHRTKTKVKNFLNIKYYALLRYILRD
jgi:capsular polysaccharide export protein